MRKSYPRGDGTAPLLGMQRLMGETTNREALVTPLCGEALWNTGWKFPLWSDPVIGESY